MLCSYLERAKSLGLVVGIFVVKTLVMPWYSKHTGEADRITQFEMRDEVARKLEEAMAKVVWGSREEEGNPENKWIVTNVKSVIEGGDYNLLVSFDLLSNLLQGDHTHQLPMHEFLQAFEPIDEVRGTDYAS